MSKKLRHISILVIVLATISAMMPTGLGAAPTEAVVLPNKQGGIITIIENENNGKKI